MDLGDYNSLNETKIETTLVDENFGLICLS